jgi:hypothetical protein
VIGAGVHLARAIAELLNLLAIVGSVISTQNERHLNEYVIALITYSPFLFPFSTIFSLPFQILSPMQTSAGTIGVNKLQKFNQSAISNLGRELRLYRVRLFNLPCRNSAYSVAVSRFPSNGDRPSSTEISDPASLQANQARLRAVQRA